MRHVCRGRVMWRIASRDASGLKHPGVGPDWAWLGDGSEPKADRVITVSPPQGCASRPGTGWSMRVPERLGTGEKGTLQPGVHQVDTMPTAAELKMALDAVMVQVTALGRQLKEAADREAKDVADAKVGR